MWSSVRALVVVISMILSLACGTANAGRGASAVAYTVSIPQPATQYVHVRMVVPTARGKATRVAMPAWAPGSYLIRDFGKHVYDVSAKTLQGEPLEVERLDKQTWQVANDRRGFELRYRVFAADLGVRTSHVDDRHASLIGTSIFMYLDGELQRRCEVSVEPPSGWTVHTALPGKGDASTELVAADYHMLADSPIELGTPEVRSFMAGGATIDYVVTGADATLADVDRLASDATRVVEAFDTMMGGLPLKRYVFLLHIARRGGGGLEHANSTSMMIRRGSFASDRGYESAAHTAAHEFFHLWNVKRIRDAALVPYDYARENHTRLLWFHEGFTSMMTELAMVRAGLTEPKAWVAELGKEWTRYLRHPGRNSMPVSALSFDAWIKAYKPEANHRNETISYYEKGRWIGIALDLELRLRSAGKGSVTGLFRRLMASHGATGKGIRQSDIVAAATAEAGEDMQWFFDKYVDGTEELPIIELMPKVGIEVRTDDGSDEGDDRSAEDRIYTGLSLRGRSVRNVEPGSPARDAGLMFDDEIIAVDGLRVADREHVERLLARHDPGSKAELTLFRDGRLRRIDLEVAENPYRTYRFRLVEKGLPDDVERVRDDWLKVY